MQKILVGLCTLFLLTAIFYKYNKDNQQDGFLWWAGRKRHKKTNCDDCEKKCKARHYIRKSKTIKAGSKAEGCVNDCKLVCL